MLDDDVRVDWYCGVEGVTYQDLVDQARDRLRQFLTEDRFNEIEVEITIEVDSIIMSNDVPVSYRATARCQI